MELFTRLTFNENNWVVPSGHTWKKANQNKTNIAYENQYGFGHEEWILNTRYHVNGFQYGYIRGLQRLKILERKVEKVHLYTVKKDKKQKIVYYLGFINEVEILDDKWETQFPKVAKVYHEFAQTVNDELVNVKADATILNRDVFIPGIRFRIEDAFLFDNPILIKDFPLNRYKRFQPYRITREILNIFNWGTKDKKEAAFKFAVGKATQTERFSRYSSASEKSIIKIHCKIVDCLEQYLKPEYSIGKENISIEKTRFEGNIADVVTIDRDRSISIYEIKTSVIARKSIREALAQLLDYASHARNIRINKLIIVSPSKLKDDDLFFLRQLRKIIKYPISYFTYDTNADGSFTVFE